MTFFKFLVVVFAFVLIGVGLITAITPVPFGLPLILIGFLLLATVSPATLRAVRRRWKWLDRRLKWLQKKLPHWMTRSLRRSDPDPDDGENNDDDATPTKSAKRDQAGIAGILRRRR